MILGTGNGHSVDFDYRPTTPEPGGGVSDPGRRVGAVLGIISAAYMIRRVCIPFLVVDTVMIDPAFDPYRTVRVRCAG